MVSQLKLSNNCDLDIITFAEMLVDLPLSPTIFSGILEEIKKSLPNQQIPLITINYQPLNTSNPLNMSNHNVRVRQFAKAIAKLDPSTFHHDVSIRRFSEIIAHLPLTLSSLYLDNNLWSIETLSAVLSSLPPSIKYLRLKEDKLHLLTNDELTHVFSQLKTITHLEFK